LTYFPTIMDPLKITPPFSYSYQCGSTLLVSYIPVYMYSVSLQLISIWVRWGISSTSLSFFLSEVWLTQWISPINWPLPLINKLDNLVPPLAKSSSTGRSNRLINPHQIISNVVSNLILLLSFGLCSPVLACYITLSTCVTAWCWVMMVGRFVACRLDVAPLSETTPKELHCATNPISGIGSETDVHQEGAVVDHAPRDDDKGDACHQTVDPFLTLLDHQLRGVNSSLVVCKWPIIFTSCFFVTMLCWDMVGDEVGWEQGLWVPIAGVLMLLTVWIWDHLLFSKMIDLNLVHHTLFPPQPISPPSRAAAPPSVELVRPSLASSPAILCSPLLLP
jgi:hypothetical protein